ncbi:hypothetical protein ACQP1V_42700 (plasmid) [Microtetraspora malaysiensis]|uniref:hypothetical protein n=1 Tax=Microtetraspora malaysiensis TaxID=161358 RepID=UPI003D8E402C
MTFVYRNDNTGQEVTVEDRDPCLDMLDNWRIVSGPALEEEGPPLDPGQALAGLVRPSEHDNKAAWIAYAVARGMSESDAKALSKASLVEELGEDDDDEDAD